MSCVALHRLSSTLTVGTVVCWCVIDFFSESCASIPEFSWNKISKIKFFHLCIMLCECCSGLATVFIGLEESAKILAKNIADETVHTVQHK